MSVSVAESVEAPSPSRGRPQNLKPWKPGQSGNPKGRPKREFDLAEQARDHAEKSIKTLVDCLTAKKAPWKDKIAAASELLDRGFGKASQKLDVNNHFTFSEEFENFVGHLNEQRKLGHMKVINGSVAAESDGVVRLAADVRSGGDPSSA
jgi:hypothetical protein